MLLNTYRSKCNFNCKKGKRLRRLVGRPSVISALIVGPSAILALTGSVVFGGSLGLREKKIIEMFRAICSAI